MNALHSRMDVRHILPGIFQSLIFMTGAVVYGAAALLSRSALLWAIYSVLLGCAVVLSVGVLRYRIRREQRPRWIIPLGAFALVVAVVFGAVH